MFVCLWSPVWRTVADSLADLSPALLTVAPRVVTEERRGGLVWVDARGLDAEHIARSAIEVLRGLGLSNVRVGFGRTAIVAELAAAVTATGTGDWGLGTGGNGALLVAGRSCSSLADAGCDRLRSSSVSEPPAPAASDKPSSPQSPVPSPSRESLGSLPIAVLEPDDTLAVLLDGIGVETCGDLAALAGESVEVRLGAEGVRLWKLARGDDDRLIFAPMPRGLPHASLEWSDYALTDTERLLFSVNALLGTVCEKLIERGSLARELTLTLTLANGATLTSGIRAGRATASRKTWLRLARTQLERMVLPAGVVGLTLQATTVVTDEGSQGDLFDRGFATAAATEAALASLAEEQGDVVVVPENSAHPLVERRTKWVGDRLAPGEVKGSGPRDRGTMVNGERTRNGRRKKRGADVAPNVARHPTGAPGAQPSGSVPHPLFPVPADSISHLTLYLLPTPRAIETQTEERRDHVQPTAYRDGGAWFKVLSSAGPDRVSGERWGEAFAREYFRCVVDDGGMVWLYRDGRADAWFIHGWWD